MAFLRARQWDRVKYRVESALHIGVIGHHHLRHLRLGHYRANVPASYSYSSAGFCAL